MVLLHFQVGLSLYVTLKHALRGLEGVQRLLPTFKGEHLEHELIKPPCAYLPQGQAHMTSHSYLKTNLVHLDTLTTIGWTTFHRMHQKIK
jgi:hypothetical protein